MTYLDCVDEGRFNLNKEGLEQYLSTKGEWFTIEYKRQSNQSKTNIKKAVCALANTNGGELFIGVSDNNEVIGTSEKMEDIEKVLAQSQLHKDTENEWIHDLNKVVSNKQTFPMDDKKTNSYP